jgi:hypothetical protein
VSAAGAAKLRTAGISVGQEFSRRWLDALRRDGDLSTASTGRLGLSIGANLEREFDFVDEVDTGSAFPACDCCSSVFGLGLVVIKHNRQLAGEVTCLDCFRKYGVESDTRLVLPPPKQNLGQYMRLLSELSTETISVTKVQRIIQHAFLLAIGIR